MLIEHTICLKLNSTGYRGRDVDSLYPVFATDRQILVGLQWEPSAEGPGSFSLVIEIGLLVSLVAQGFLKELTRDLYKWIKVEWKTVFEKKNAPAGRVLIRYKDVNISYFVEFDVVEPTAEFFKNFPELTALIDPAVSHEWEAYESPEGEFLIAPLFEHSEGVTRGDPILPHRNA